MKLVKVKVVAPEGRFYFGLGGRACGQVFELPETVAKTLAAGDPGLEINTEAEAADPEPPAPKKAGRAAKPAEVTDNG